MTFQPFLLGAAVFGVFAVLLLAVRRGPTTRHPMLILAGGALIAYVGGLIVVPRAGVDLALWAFSAVYWCLVMWFFFVFAGLYKSVSVRILNELLQRPGHRQSYREVMESYLVEESYRGRIDNLVDKGYLALEEGRLHLTEKGRRFAMAVRMLQRLYLIERSG